MFGDCRSRRRSMLRIGRCVKLAAALLVASLSGCGDSDKTGWGHPQPPARPTVSTGDPGLAAELPGRLPSTVIVEPPAGAEVTSPEIAVSGVINPPLRHLEAFIVTRDRFNWFIQWPPVRVDPRTGEFIQENVRVATPGKWELHLVIVSPQTGRLFHDRAERGDWGGMAALPPGTTSAASVSIKQVDRTQAGR
jgi:hypothetical protein